LRNRSDKREEAVAELAQSPRRPAGFTLIELVTVMVVVGVLAAVAMPRFFDNKGFDAVAYSDQVKALMRYGQKIAIAQGRNVFVRVNSSSVALCMDLACGVPLAPAAGSNSGSRNTIAQCGNPGWACEGLPNGLTMTPSLAQTFYFDPTGKPFASANVPPTLVSTFADLIINITGDGAAHPITVTAETGYVY
jgi:MSHA pilin protein MshC